MVGNQYPYDMIQSSFHLGIILSKPLSNCHTPKHLGKLYPLKIKWDACMQYV